MDDQGPEKPEGPVVGVFRTGKTGPVRTSAVPPAPSTPPSEPPAQAVVREALLLDLAQKLLGVDELYALLDTATHYRLLNVASTASPAQIREAYFNCARCFHPYTFVLAANDERRVKVTAVFEALTRAYEALRRASTRAAYDDAIGLPTADRFGTTPAVAVLPPSPGPAAAAPAAPEPSATRSVAPSAPARASVRPAAPRSTSLRMSGVPQRPSRPGVGARPMMLESHAPAAQRERASAAKGAERDFVVDDGSASGRSSHVPGQRTSFAPEPGSGGTRNPFDNEGSLEEAVRRSSTLLRELDKVAQARLRSEEETCPSILEIANQVRGGGAMSNWAAGRLRDAHNAEQAGQLHDAASILKSVHNQLRDPHVQTHAQRIARLIIQKG